MNHNSTQSMNYLRKLKLNCKILVKKDINDKKTLLQKCENSFSNSARKFYFKTALIR